MKRYVKAARIAERTVHGASRAAAFIGATAIFVIMLAIVADVLHRNTATRSVPGVVEGSEVTLVIAVFLGLGLAERTSAHVSTTVVTDRVPRLAQLLLYLVGTILSIGFVAIFLTASAEMALASWQSNEYRFGLLQMPVWPARIAIAVGCFLLLLELVIRLAHEAIALAHHVRHRAPRTRAGARNTDTERPVH